MSEDEELNEAQEIAAGQVAERLLGNEVLVGALDRIEQRAFAQFKSADTDEKRRAAHALALVRDTLTTELSAVRERGRGAAIERDRREQQASRARARR